MREDDKIRPWDGAMNGDAWILMKDLAALARAQARLTAHIVRLVEKQQGPTRESALEPGSPEVDKKPEAFATPEAAAPAVAPAPVEWVAAEPGPEPAVTPAPAPAPEPEPEEVAAPAGEVVEELDDQGEQEATVLTLESGDARVGVLWDQVSQIGSLSTPTVPATVETERGRVELTSLGRLLHGISREENYFVVLEQDGERAAVACERMLGLGPLGTAARQEPNARIQVVKVPMLRAFSGRPADTATSATATATAPAPEPRPSRGAAHPQRSEEERDIVGPLRALVAVRYLPARVAICRYLRGRGWQVGEAAGIEAASVSLDLGRWDALFLETRANGESDEVEANLLHRAGEKGIPMIRVGSRITGAPGQGGPALIFPFSEEDLDATLVQAGADAGA